MYYFYYLIFIYMWKVIVKDLIKYKRTRDLNEISIEISRYIIAKDKHKNVYFWTPSKLAWCRRYKEYEKEKIIKLSNWIELQLRRKYKESCKNCYFYSSVYLWNSSKDVRFLKKLLEEINKKLEKRKTI